jgi:hypothetical protein
MALIQLPYAPPMYDFFLTSAQAVPALVSTLLIDASAEKCAFVGSIWHPTIKTGTIAIRKVLFRTGALSLGANSQIRVSLQDVSATAGPPYQPDGGQDQFYDFKTATTTLSASTWSTTGNLSADRTVDLAVSGPGVANSRLVAVVFEYQAFTAADSLVIAGFNTSQLSLVGGSLLNVASWAQQAAIAPIVAFELSDGTNAFMLPGCPWSGVGTVSVGNAAAIRRAGVRFRFPVTCSIDRISLSVVLPNGADGTLTLYDTNGTTVLRSMAIDNDAVRSAAAPNYADFQFEPVTLLANTFYRAAFVSTTSTTATVPFVNANSAALTEGGMYGQNAFWTQHDGSNWDDSITARRPGFSIGINSVNNDSIVVNSGMTGGMRG